MKIFFLIFVNDFPHDKKMASEKDTWHTIKMLYVLFKYIFNYKWDYYNIHLYLFSIKFLQIWYGAWVVNI